MASVSECKNQLWRIGQQYPTIGGMLQRETGSKTVGQIWGEILAKYDEAYIVDVVDEYCSCRRRIPDPSDRLIMDIVEEVSARQTKDDTRFEQHQKYHSRKKMPWRSPSAVPVCEAVRYVLVHGPIPQSQVDELKAWNQGGHCPDWVYGEKESARDATTENE